MAAKRKRLSQMHFSKRIKFENIFQSLTEQWLEMSADMGLVAIPPDSTVEMGVSKDKKSGHLIIPVTRGFLARLPFVDKEKARKWNEAYKEEVKKASEKFGSRWMDWDNLSACGKCAILIGENGKIDGRILFHGLADVTGPDGERLGGFHLFQNREYPSTAIINDYSKESLESLTEQAAAMLARPSQCYHSTNRNFIESIMEIAIEILTETSDWHIRPLRDGMERMAWVLHPGSIDYVAEEMAPRVREITGTLAHPVFPPKEAVFILVADFDNDSTCKISLDGPFPCTALSLEDECQLYGLAENPGAKSLFSKEIDIEQILEDCEKESALLAQSLALSSKIGDSAGILRNIGEESIEELDIDKEDFEGENSF